MALLFDPVSASFVHGRRPEWSGRLSKCLDLSSSTKAPLWQGDCGRTRRSRSSRVNVARWPLTSCVWGGRRRPGGFARCRRRGWSGERSGRRARYSFWRRHCPLCNRPPKHHDADGALNRPPPPECGGAIKRWVLLFEKNMCLSI